MRKGPACQKMLLDGLISVRQQFLHQNPGGQGRQGNQIIDGRGDVNPDDHQKDPGVQIKHLHDDHDAAGDAGQEQIGHGPAAG